MRATDLRDLGGSELMGLDQGEDRLSVRAALVRELAEKGVSSSAALKAMGEVPRHRFVARECTSLAYHDRALPISCGQTISQPFVVATMTEVALGDRPKLGRVLEVGTGSGYQSAVLAAVAEEVYSIERIGHLSRSAAEALRKAKVRNVHLRCADGRAGWPEAAPFEAIVVTAAARNIAPAWLEQLADGGVLVTPLGQGEAQQLLEIRKIGEKIERRAIYPVLFVPLLSGVED